MKTACLFFILVAVSSVSLTEALKCQTAGFFADPLDCERFTMCYENTIDRGMVGVDMSCPPGMAFERDDGYCSQAARGKFCAS